MSSLVTFNRATLGYGRRAVLTDTFSKLILLKTAFGNQPLITKRNFYRIQIFALNVFDERHLQHLLVVC